MKNLLFYILFFLLSCKKENINEYNIINSDSLTIVKVNPVIDNQVTFTDNDTNSTIKLDTIHFYTSDVTKSNSEINNPDIYKYHYDSQMQQIQDGRIEQIKAQSNSEYWNNRPDFSSKVIKEYNDLQNRIEYSKPEYNLQHNINPNHNPDLIDVNTYEKSNGTVVEGHIRTRANSTVKDNLKY